MPLMGRTPKKEQQLAVNMRTQDENNWRPPECPPPDPAPAPWPTIPDNTPPSIAELVQPRDGWTPASWRARLEDLAAACGSVNPARAAELRAATRLFDKGGHG